MTSCRFSRWRISAILDCRDPIMGYLKSSSCPCTRSLIETIALNCLVFEKISFFCILATERQTDRQTDKQMDIIDAWSCSLAVASCGLLTGRLHCPSLALLWVERLRVYIDVAFARPGSATGQLALCIWWRLLSLVIVSLFFTHAVCLQAIPCIKSVDAN